MYLEVTCTTSTGITNEYRWQLNRFLSSLIIWQWVWWGQRPSTAWTRCTQYALVHVCMLREWALICYCLELSVFTIYIYGAFSSCTCHVTRPHLVCWCNVGNYWHACNSTFTMITMITMHDWRLYWKQEICLLCCPNSMNNALDLLGRDSKCAYLHGSFYCCNFL